MADLDHLRAGRFLRLMFFQQFRSEPELYFAALVNFTRLCDKASLDWGEGREQLLRAVARDADTRPGNWSVDNFLAYFRCLDHVESTIEAADRAIAVTKTIETREGGLAADLPAAPTDAQRRAVADLRNGIRHRESDLRQGDDVSRGPFHLWLQNDRLFVGTWEMELDDLADVISRLHAVADVLTRQYNAPAST